MKPKVLLIDDEPINLLTFRAFLEEDGYDIFSAGDGVLGIEQARELSPDVILLDVMMPGLDGFDVCRTLRRDPLIGHVPIIIVTALHDSASRLAGLQAGADDFLTKPCVRDEIRARVRTIVSLNRFRTIAEQRARFEQLYDLAPVAIVVTSELGVVVAANPHAERLLAGEDGGPLTGRSIVERFGPDAATVLGVALATALEGAPMPPQEIRRRRGQEDQVLRMRGTSIPDGGNRRAMLILSDVTAEVHGREALETLNRELDSLVRSRTRQLEDANSLLLSYASFVSHDLRTPLSVAKGYLSMIQEGAVPLANASALVANAYQATITMEELVQNILQLAHDEHMGAGPSRDVEIDPVPIIHHVWAHVARMVPHGARKFTVHPLPWVRASPLLLERVFYNLLTNAAKYSVTRPSPCIDVGTHQGGPDKVIYVRDNGVGFDHRDAAKLFRDFSRLPGAVDGESLGLGLSLAARLVRGRGGRIWAEGQPGVGATFFVAFGASGEPTRSAG